MTIPVLQGAHCAVVLLLMPVIGIALQAVMQPAPRRQAAAGLTFTSSPAATFVV
jgi:hypothetical protein